MINSLLDKHHSKKAKSYHIATAHLTFKQWLRIKSSIVNTNNWLNEIFPSFNREHSPGFCLVDTFSGHFSFYSVNQKDANIKITHCNKFNSIYEDSLIDQNTIPIISDASVKNNVTTSVLYIHRGQDIITKTVYHLMNIMSTEAELFAIRCGINDVTQIQDIAYTLLLSQMPFQPLNVFLTHLSIHINCTLLLYPMILEASLTRTLIIQFYSVTVLIATSGLLIYWLTKSQNISR